MFSSSIFLPYFLHLFFSSPLPLFYYLLSVSSSQVWGSCATSGKRLFQGFRCGYEASVPTAERIGMTLWQTQFCLVSLHLALSSISSVWHKLKDKTLCQMKNFVGKRASLMLCWYLEFTCWQPSSENSFRHEPKMLFYFVAKSSRSSLAGKGMPDMEKKQK